MKFRLVIFGLFVVAALYAQIPVMNEMKGPLTDALWIPDHPATRGNEFANDLPEFEAGDIVRVEFDFHRTLTTQNLAWFGKTIRERREEADESWNLVALDNYWRDTGEELSGYLPRFMPEDFNIEEWGKELAKNPAVWGDLITEDITTLRLMIYIPEAEGDLQIRQKLDDLLGSIEFPEGVTIRVLSWAKTRGDLSKGFFDSVYLWGNLAYLFLFVPFLAILFRFQKDLYVSVAVATFLPVLITLGSLWPLAAFFGIYCTVYTLPPLSTTQIMALSFNVQKTEAFLSNPTWESTRERWKMAGKSTHRAIALVAILTIANFFLFGWNFSSLWRVLEMDAVFMIGVVVAWATAVYFLPAIHSLFRAREKMLKPWQEKCCGWVDDRIQWLVERAKTSNLKSLDSRPRRVAINTIPVLLFSFAAAGFVLNYFLSVAEPLNYLDQKSKTVEDARYANRPGGPGLAPIRILFGMPEIQNAVEMEEFYELARNFQRELANAPDVRSTWSIEDEIEFQLQNNPRLREPRLKSAWALVREGEAEISPRFSRYNHTDRFVAMMAFHPQDRSDKYGEALDWIRGLAKKYTDRNPNLRIELYGDHLYFPPMATEVVEQFAQAVLYTLVAVFLFYSLAVKRRSLVDPGSGWILGQTFLFATGVVGIGMMVFRIHLDMATAAILWVTLAAAADFNIYLVVRFLELANHSQFSIEEALRLAFDEKGKAVVVDWCGNSLCLLLLMFSSFSPVRYLGLMSLASLALCMIWSLFATLPSYAAGMIEKEKSHDALRLVVTGTGGRGVNPA